MKFFKKQRVIIALLLYIAIIAGFIYLVIFPLLARMNAINDQIQQEDMKKESVKLHIEELPKIQKQYQTLQINEDLTGVLLDKNKIVILFEKLEKLAEKTNNKMTIAMQDNVIAKKTPVKNTVSSEGALVAGLPSAEYLQMKITLIGNYNSIMIFFDLLEKFEYYSDIITIQINKNDESKIPQSSLGSGLFGTNSLTGIDNPNTSLDAVGENTLKASFDTVFYTN